MATDDNASKSLGQVQQDKTNCDSVKIRIKPVGDINISSCCLNLQHNNRAGSTRQGGQGYFVLDCDTQERSWLYFHSSQPEAFAFTQPRSRKKGPPSGFSKPPLVLFISHFTPSAWNKKAFRYLPHVYRYVLISSYNLQTKSRLERGDILGSAIMPTYAHILLVWILALYLNHKIIFTYYQKIPIRF